jgi:hypothetical protein
LSIGRNKKRSKPQLPTVEQFLRFKPKRIDIEWKENTDGIVEINIPKFQSNLGKSFCRVLRKNQSFTGHMDKIGSLVWINCDGVNTVADILKVVKKRYPTEKNIDQRLFLFIQQMGNLNYLRY